LQVSVSFPSISIIEVSFLQLEKFRRSTRPVDDSSFGKMINIRGLGLEAMTHFVFQFEEATTSALGLAGKLQQVYGFVRQF
jgi:hypothetical protein